MKKKLLLVLAHPDDESFVSGGTIAKYSQLGWQIGLICATKGEAGDRGLYEEDIQLAEIRSQELNAAASVLGISSLSFLPFSDGKLKDVNPGELEDVLYKKLMEYEPDVVITFEPNGITNHPDHMRICISTTFAFQKYAKFFVSGKSLGNRDPRRKFVKKLGGYEGRAEPKLYYACMPQSVAEYLQNHEVLPKESYGKPWKGIPDKTISTVIDISDFTETKVKAIAQHTSQRKDAEKFLSIDTQPLVYKEYYILRMQGTEEVFMGKNDDVQFEL